MKRTSRQRMITWVTLAAFLITTTGCGYLLHPERQTTKPSNEVDGTIVLFDCLWLLVFIVPGVVALVVDGVEKTWYYSEDEWKAKVERSGISKNVEPGQNLVVRIHGYALRDAKVTLSLLDKQGQNVTPAIEAQSSVGKGTIPLAVRVPQQVNHDKLFLVLAVNDQQQCCWNLDVTLAPQR